MKRLNDESPIVIRDLDEVVTKEEVLEAVTEAHVDAEARLVSLKKVYGGAQTAVMMLQTAAAKKLCAAGRLRVGPAFTRVRPIELLVRCARCLESGHVAWECKGVDRSTCCWRCRVAGHFNRNCDVSTKTAAALRATLLNRPAQGADQAATEVGEAITTHHDD